MTPTPPTSALTTTRKPFARAAGLLIPGAGQALHGDWVAAVMIAVATAFLWLAVALEIIVHNRSGFPAPLHLWAELGALRWPVTIVPEIPVVVLFALTLHLGSAWLAGSARFGAPRASTAHGIAAD